MLRVHSTSDLELYDIVNQIYSNSFLTAQAIEIVTCLA